MDVKMIEGCKTCEKQIFQQEKCYEHRSQNTHTLNKSNQFYISKKSQDSLGEHTLTHVKPFDGQITLYLHMYQE